MLLLGSNSTGSHASGDIAEAVDFDGTNDYLSRTSDLTGNADGKTFTFSAWVYLVSGASYGYLYACDNGTDIYFQVRVESDNDLWIVGFNSSLTLILSFTASAKSVRNTFAHILVSVDLSSTSNRGVYINDILQASTWDKYTNDTIDFTQSNHSIGGVGYLSRSDKARLAHLYLDYTYRDLSVEANRRLFITSDRKPADNQAALNPILYLPMTDPATVHINEGTGGNFTLNGVVARSGRGPNQFNAPYSDLDGAADYLTRVAAPTGIADGKQFTFACCFNASDFTNENIIHFANNTSPRFVVRFTSDNTINLIAYNSSGTNICQLIDITDGVLYRNYVFVVSADLTDANKCHLYVNGVSSLTQSTYTNDTINFMCNRYQIGRDAALSTNYFNGRLGNVFFHTTYVDLSIPANLAKFCTGTGIDCKPVDMGANGELPLGTSPLIYLPMYANNAGKNYGTGGNFVMNSGPYTGAKGPNEFWGNKADFDGSTGYLARTSALAGVSDGKTFSCSFWITPDTDGAAGYVLGISTGSGIHRLEIIKNGSNQLQLVARTSTTDVILNAYTSSVVTAGTSNFIQLCVDLASSSTLAFYINGVAATMAWATYVDATINMSESNLDIGAKWNGSARQNFLDGKLSEFYFTTSYIDFSQEANRLKFRDAFGNPVDLTAQIEAGEIPEPAIYMRFDPANQGKNYGTGGDFVKSGTILDGGQL